MRLTMDDRCICGHLWSSHGKGPTFEDYAADPYKPCKKPDCECKSWELPQSRIV